MGKEHARDALMSGCDCLLRYVISEASLRFKSTDIHLAAQRTSESPLIGSGRACGFPGINGDTPREQFDCFIGTAVIGQEAKFRIEWSSSGSG